MDDVREIVTKAVVAKGRKILKIKDTIDTGKDISSVLGCWIINHNYNAKITAKNEVTVSGNAETDVWSSICDNTQTDVIRKTFNYIEVIKTRRLVKELCNDNLDILVTIVDEPTCTNVDICDNQLIVDITLEVVVEVIGETKVQVIVCEPIELLEDNFENEINENFIKEG